MTNLQKVKLGAVGLNEGKWTFELLRLDRGGEQQLCNLSCDDVGTNVNHKASEIRSIAEVAGEPEEVILKIMASFWRVVEHVRGKVPNGS